MHFFLRCLNFVTRLLIKLKNDDIFASAAQLSYYLILAFFPFIIFIFTLIGYFNLDESVIIDGMQLIFPSNVHSLITSTINQIINVRNGELLWVSLLVVAVAASTGFRGVIKAINRSYGVVENRCFPHVWIISILSTVILTIAILLNLTLLVFGESIGLFFFDKLGLDDTFLYCWSVLRHLITLGFIVFFFASIYKFTPSYKPKWREVYIGSIFSTLSWILVSVIFSQYMNNTNNMSILYGGLSAMFGLITWLYISSFVFILGMEINSVYSIQRNSKSLIIK